MKGLQRIRKRRKHATKAGLPPGTLVHTGEKKTTRPTSWVIRYNEKTYEEQQTDGMRECPLPSPQYVTWLNVDGLHDLELIEKIGHCFGIHPLVLEDIAHIDQRPKLEDYDSYMYIVLKMLTFDDTTCSVDAEQVSLVLGKDFILSFQEKEGDVFGKTRDRLRQNKGLLRKSGADHLIYTLLDSVVDHYFVTLEKLGDYVEELEDRIVAHPTPETLQELHDLRRQIIYLRKAVWPLREVISGMERLESPLVNKGTAIYLRDVYDHTIRVIDSVETFRDLVAGMMDIYMSGVNNRINSVMKVLTVITTVFMPLTLISGIYGMNFQYMPELHWHYGYPLVLVSMGVIAISMLLLFKTKRWL